MKDYLHILSAEDQRLYAEIVRTLFEDAGHRVVTVEDGQEALDLAAVEKFDLLVTDHKMPRVDGLVLVTRLKETGFTGKMIVHSSRLSEQEVASYRRLKVDLIVIKGSDTENLVGLTNKLFVA